MIRELRIKNLALIENLELEFGSGFTVFTGETGAGKSILIGAIGLLLGERASSEMIRSGCDDAEVSGCLEIEILKPKLRDFLKEAGIDADDGSLIIRRNISKAGKNRIHVNQIPLPLSSLKTLGDLLIDLHGQHQHQSLLNENTHVDIADSLPETLPSRENYTSSYNTYITAKQEFIDAQRAAKELADKKDVLEFQYKELSALDPQTDEEQALEQELSLLSTSAQRIECAKEVLELLGSSDGESIQKRLTHIKRKLETLGKYDPAVRQYSNDMEAVISTCSELDIFCSSYLEKIDGGDNAQGRIEAINARLSKIQRLKKKYSCTLNELIEKKQELAKNLSLLQNSSADIDALKKKSDKSRQSCIDSAAILTKSRKKALSKFDKEITRRMEQLGFPGGEWKTELSPLEEPSSSGMEEIIFLVKTNPGEPFLPLAKTASGGEISRLMLAVKSILAEQDEIPVLIFDEIDTGIGGVLAGEVSKALYSLSSTHQVLCISHLHQIASAADHHYLVAKKASGGRTVTEVTQLNDKQRTMEIARMLGGETQISIKHAEQLLKDNQRR
ncbi:MAG: DNA repair protein RecN [Chitinispirillia bacterium]|nr:DNA repair protein RecN [Chitinispirillia bacterium]MCL2240906.1 DNA repair protein RecN [Chitinispirillia bacterium]